LFPSRDCGYSWDKRDDRPQIVIGLLVTGKGIPIAHYVFPGNTRDSTTLGGVMADYRRRFGIGRIALVADRSLISEANLDQVQAAGFDHVLATSPAPGPRSGSRVGAGVERDRSVGGGQPHHHGHRGRSQGHALRRRRLGTPADP
jgi:hypothetical protein